MAADGSTADRSTAELERFLAERADHLLRTAALLAGSREAGEDLLQTAIERLLPRWRRFDGDPEGYLRRTLCNLAIDSSRRASRWRLKEGLFRTGLRPVPDAAGEVDLRDALVRLLWKLPPQPAASGSAVPRSPARPGPPGAGETRWARPAGRS